MIETMKAEIKTFNEGLRVGELSSLNQDKEAKVKALKPHVFKCIRDAQEVKNFL